MTYKVAFTKVLEVNPHPNPEVTSLDVITVYGFQVISRRGTYKVGDFCLFVPPDSVLDPLFESIFLGPNPKIKFSKGRVKQIRIQKFPSAGLLVSVETVQEYCEKKSLKVKPLKLEEDMSEFLNILKYEPPSPHFQGTPGEKTARPKNLVNTNFSPYRGCENIKWFPTLFAEGEQVVIQEKLHGSNCRVGKVPTQANTVWKRIKKFFGLLPKYELVYGSNNVELTNRDGNKNFYGSNVYLKVLNSVDAFDKVQENEIVYGELIGEGIQKNYDYGHKVHHFVIFDVKIIGATGETLWLTPSGVKEYAKNRGFDVVPYLYEGPYTKDIAYELTKGDSVYCPKQKIREGIVIKSVDYNNKGCASGRKALKYISEEFLDRKDNTDFH